MDLSIPKLWEFHPMLVHFPIAFLTAGVAIEVFALRRSNDTLRRAAIWLLLAGVGSGWLAAAAGGLAYFTVPAHTEKGHELMYWHLGLGLTMLAIFTWVSISRWRTSIATRPQLIVELIGIVLLVFTGHLGSSIVYRHGAGVDPRILAPEIREGHSHQNGHSHQQSTTQGHDSH